jgi:23S rRNA pseudouridine955/2504/2580 synthase
MQFTRIWSRRKLGSSYALKISAQSVREINIFKVDESGIRLDKFLRKKVDNPMSHIFRSIRKKEIKVTFVGGKRVPKSNKNDFKLDTNMHVSLFNKNFVLKEEQIIDSNNVFEPSIKFKTLYEDNDIVVIDKPPEFPVHDGSKQNVNITDELLKKYNYNGEDKETKIYIVHRLDKSTSGCLMFAKNRRTARYFFKEFKNRTIKKMYIGTVFLPLNEVISVDNNNNSKNYANADTNDRKSQYKKNKVRKYKKDKDDKEKHSNNLIIYDLVKTSYGVRPADETNKADSRKTMTKVFPLELSKAYSEEYPCHHTTMKKQNIIYQPITGHKHQLRALSAFFLKAPIVGDKKYTRFVENLPPGSEDIINDDKLHLHAWVLQFTHPLTKKIITIESDIPEYILKHSDEKPTKKHLLRSTNS